MIAATVLSCVILAASSDAELTAQLLLEHEANRSRAAVYTITYEGTTEIFFGPPKNRTSTIKVSQISEYADAGDLVIKRKDDARVINGPDLQQNVANHQVIMNKLYVASIMEPEVHSELWYISRTEEKINPPKARQMLKLISNLSPTYFGFGDGYLSFRQLLESSKRGARITCEPSKDNAGIYLMNFYDGDSLVKLLKVDSSQGTLITSSLDFDQGQKLREMHVKAREYNGLWFPSEWKMDEYYSDGSPRRRLVCRIQELSLATPSVSFSIEDIISSEQTRIIVYDGGQTPRPMRLVGSQLMDEDMARLILNQDSPSAE